MVKQFICLGIESTAHTFGIGIITSGLDKIPYTTLDGTGRIVRDTFEDTENAYIISYGLPLADRFGSIYGGASLKFITQNFSKISGASAFGYDLDLGVLYRLDDFSLGVLLQKGVQLSWSNGHQDAGPFTMKFGISNKLKLYKSISLLGSADLIQRQRDPMFINAGCELGFSGLKKKSSVSVDGLFLRFGVDNYAFENRYGNSDQINGSLNLNTGAGINMSLAGCRLQIDYVSGMYRLGDKTRISINIFI